MLISFSNIRHQSSLGPRKNGAPGSKTRRAGTESYEACALKCAQLAFKLMFIYFYRTHSMIFIMNATDRRKKISERAGAGEPQRRTCTLREPNRQNKQASRDDTKHAADGYTQSVWGGIFFFFVTGPKSETAFTVGNLATPTNPQHMYAYGSLATSGGAQ